MRFRETHMGRQIGMAGSIEGISRGTRYRHHNSWLDTTAAAAGTRNILQCACPAGHQNTKQLNDGRPESHEDDGGEDKQDQRDDHLDGGFGSLFFGALTAFGAQRIGVNTKCLRDAGAEAIGLNQGGDQGAHVVDAGALDQVA